MKRFSTPPLFLEVILSILLLTILTNTSTLTKTWIKIKEIVIKINEIVSNSWKTLFLDKSLKEKQN